jgi:Tol biopolymer transport system component
MTRFERVEPRLSELLTELAAPSLPDYTDDVLARTAGLRQRPRWTLPERWLPMGVLAQRSVYMPRLPWRTVIVAALLLVALAATLAWFGSQRRAAPPFGLARNGMIMYAVDGDLVTWDPDTEQTTTILSGPTDDFTGMFSRDGTKLAFLRRERQPSATEPELISIQVANADGSNPTDTTGPLEAPDQWDWSPAGDLIAVQSLIDGHRTLQVVPTDGSERPRMLETGMEVTFVSFLPPNGEEIVFRGVTPASDGSHSGLFAISPNGGQARPLTETDGHAEFDYQGPTPSPDGRHLVYQAWDPAAERVRFHMLDLATGADETFGETGARYGEGGGMFSPDGKLIAYRGYSDGAFQLWIVPADRSAEPRPLGGYVQGDAWHEFSPDGTTVMVNRTGSGAGSGTLLIDVATGDSISLPDSTEPGTWQRLAP